MSFIFGSNRPRTYLELNYITPILWNNLFSGGGELGNQAASPEVNFGSQNGASLRNCHWSTSELGANFHTNNQMLPAAGVCNAVCFTGWDGRAGRTGAEQARFRVPPLCHITSELGVGGHGRRCFDHPLGKNKQANENKLFGLILGWWTVELPY